MKQKIWILRMDFQVYVCITVIMLIFCVSERGIAQEMDFGDAPAPYPTFSDANGARHIINPDVYLGSGVDTEEDGQPDGGAQGDDNNGDDDEDGVTFTSSLVPGSTANVTVVASVQGTLNAWMDFNIDGDWDDAGEQIFVDLTLVSGTNNLDFDLPPGAASGSTFARFRFSLQPALSFVGDAEDGEVEDYQVEIDVPEPSIDIEKYTNGQDADTPTGPVVQVGSQVTWTYEVTNTGNVPLSSVTVTDNQGVAVSCPGTSLDPWESMICEASGTAAAGQYENVGRAAAISPQGQDVVGQDVSHYFGELPPTDFGDAPDPSFPTLLASNGARHIIVPGIYMGPFPADADADGQPDSSATGDDADGNDDEDGIGYSGELALGEVATLLIDVPVDGYLNAWMDFSGDGNWQVPNEQIFTNEFLTAGTNSVEFTIPANADPDGIARFRFNTTGGLSFDGLAMNGEVEDHKFLIHRVDFGDAPEPYPTLRGNNGARHAIGIPYLGSSVDDDQDGQPNDDATGDDVDGNNDDDGVTFTSPMMPGATANVTVIASETDLYGYGLLSAWIDFNRDDDWADAGEKIFSDEQLSNGPHDLSFNVPSGASPGLSFARFRFIHPYVSGLSYEGFASQGEVEDYQVEILEPMDYGDAPDTYHTMLANNGARHAYDADVYLGLKLDLEPDGQPDPGAAGDDLNGDDDEDGVSISSPMRQGQPYQITVTASTEGVLNAWLDFNDDGFWTIPDEQIFTDEPLVPGPNPLTFNVPIEAVVGATFARFRFSRQAGLLFDDRAEDGEVEDYVVEILEAELDFGDAPDDPDDPNDYPTLLASNGARHVIVPGIRLGSIVDAELDGQPTQNADGDDNDGNDDEDGVSWEYLWRGHTDTVDVIASTAGLLNAWIDFNVDGDWADPGEQIFTDHPLIAGANQLSFYVPDGPALGATLGRFRFSTEAGLSFVGQAKDGEVEDSSFCLEAYDFGDAPDPPYPTLLTSNGASHPSYPHIRLGSTVDYEVDGQPDPNAMGDDNAGADDEDGVIFTSAIFPGGTATVTVVSPSPSRVFDAWLDFTIDGDWDDAGEHIFDDVLLNAGPNNLSFNVPEGASPGLTFARFRVSADPVYSYDGQGEGGEVEDYQVEILELLDYGDAPDTYRTLLASNGARHAYDADVYLGLKLDLEPDGQPDAGAAGDDLNGDNDEDGVSIPVPMHQGRSYQITVTASTEGLLNAWLDFNGDGVWNVPDEQIFTDQVLAAGPNSLKLDVPIYAATGVTFARFRFSRQGSLSFEGRAEDGEVEDYIVEILEAELDYGDAPDDPDDPSDYPTLLASDGARHVIDSGVYLGSIIDSESDGQPDSHSHGDDSDGSDDEDGISFPWTFLAPGEINTAQVTASTEGYINAWIDLNSDGNWAGVNEQILADRHVTAGTNSLDFSLPEDTPIAFHHSRFRFNTTGGLSYTGLAQNGEVEDEKVYIQGLDFGDAPEPYPTLRSQNGARHMFFDLVYLGYSNDIDFDGQPDPDALGDDGDGNDDEDGVTFTSPLVPGNTANVKVYAPFGLGVVNGYLNAWIDFSRDGDWADPGEQILTDSAITNYGDYNLSFSVPPGASVGATFARFRISRESGISYDGFAYDGEVEDYQVEIRELLDYGDAPDTYRTLLASNGARHAYDADVYLGLKLDLETDGQPDAGAAGDDNNGDDDEDGVNFTSPLWRGEPYTVTVTASTEGLLNAWVDFNDDGTWSIPDEQIFTDQGLVSGPNTLTFNVPRDATIGDTFARFRFSRQGGLLFGERAEDGEVEDYVVEIVKADMDFGDAPDPTYPTLWENNGARHVIAPGVRLGQNIDAEDDGQPDPDAIGDDFFGVSDEAGVSWSYCRRGRTETLTVYPSTGGFINAWMDFNADGDWADPGEHAIQNKPVAAGTQSLPFNVPANAVIGKSFARIRFSTYDGLSYEGLAWDGEVEDHDILVSEVDYGDAPPPYPTKLLDNGASHDVKPLEYGLTFLGSGVDGEVDGQPESSALGDDNDGNDDEDGVAFVSPLVPGDPAVIEVTLSSAHELGYLYGWIDFNGDGDWADPDDCIIHKKYLPTGTHLLNFTVPIGASPGLTFARFRIVTDEYSVISYVGFAYDGEVEDYQVEIAALPDLDYGDAPDPTYPTLEASNGARHIIDPNIFLGLDIDADPDGQPHAGSQGDDNDGNDDEDGVNFLSPLVQGTAAGVKIIASVPGVLNAWIDFNGDGDWADADDHVFIDQPLGGGSNVLPVNVPSDAKPGATFARFRFCTRGELSYEGEAVNGEVEDYHVEIEELTSAITGKVWSDKNSSGGIDLGEPGIPGVTLDLLDPGGSLLDTSITDTNGDYYFYNLSAGDYVVDVTDTGNVLASYVLTTANDPAPITLAQGQTVEINFGYYQQTATMDFGDVPDPSYPTLLGSDGARHIVDTGVYLGPGIDAELDGKPDPGAQGDDNAGMDDEDGVTGLTSQLIPGDKPTVTVSASIDGYLNAWIDFNQNGDWSDPGEQIFTNEFIAPGPNNLTFKVPTTAVSGATFARFRYNTKGGLSFHGLADDGEVEDYLVEIGELRLDFGDAPDSYSTKLGKNGARHPIVTGVYMGTSIDDESDGQDSADAQGDDSAGSDDEDGAVFKWRILPGAMSGVQVTASTKGNLYGYMDFNNDGDFGEPDEYISSGAVLYKGVNKCYFNVPSSAVTGPTFARLRFSTETVMSYDGQAEDGEVEDYQVEIEDPGNMDFGDAPDSYSTKMVSDGARHVYVPGVHLGNSVDYEADGQPNAAATGDDLAGGANDEDGVILTSSLMPGNKAYVAVTVSKLGFLNAWIDFNIDGDWADSGERIFYFEMVFPGLNSMNFNVPAGAVLGETYARFRFSTSPFSISYDKLAHDGEVEDYKVEIGASTQKCGDTNGDGVVDINDAIVILSYLFLGGPPPSCPPAPYCCADVNGDGVVDVSDATALLAYLYVGAPPPVNSCCQGPPSPVTVPTVQIAVGIFNVVGQAGGNVTLAVNAGDTTGLGIGAAVMHLTYDPDVLTPVGVNTEGTIASGWDVAYDTGGLGTSGIFYDAGTIQEAGDGHIVVALAGSQELSGSGSLVNVVFSVSNDAVEGQSSPIQLSDISFSSGNPSEVDGEAEFAVGEFSSIPLQSGWNLISLPLEPPNPDPAIVLSPIAGRYNSVWAYDPNAGWSTYIPGGPGGLVEIRAGKGYWIEMDESWDLGIQGTIPEPTAITLWGGKWNLVGYNSSDQKSVEEAIGSVGNYIDSVYEYSPITGWSVYPQEMPGNLEVMKPGYGYWIKANETCDWDVNAP